MGSEVAAWSELLSGPQRNMEFFLFLRIVLITDGF